MNIEHPERLQPAILLGIVNERLRHHCNNMADLEEDLGLSQIEIETKLESIGFHYQSALNQFKTTPK
ncbi:DUF4250 domain-containing protein [Ferrimonas aestuarii]|uniref:DUF4250 domain-containing protein n=1 Tax=Ferrimonas aestuarii TaxID=2569539 RepID=A0A4U1BIT7_9GAMM|nr:DUF4250 domain-containing protein [Ferrimonas aestuarii]TKB50708.1 DUF4250 domain-containing protein [Ferrimonas aestuarii]